MYATKLKDASRQRLMQDLKNVVTDIEMFLAGSAGEAGATYDVALARVKTALDAAKVHVDQAQRGIAEDTRTAARAADAYVHENVWKALAVAAGAGVIAGLVLMRR